MSQSRFTAVVVLAAGLLATGLASAQIRSWNFGDGTAPGACSLSSSTYGNTMSCSEQPNGATTTLTAQAFSNTGSSGTTYASAAINYWGTGSGVGVYNKLEGYAAGSPDHSMDNSGTGSDMLLMTFDTTQILKSVTIGWSGADGDFQVLRWAGAGALTTTAGKTAAQLLTAGWELVSTVNGAGGTSSPDAVYGVNAGNVSSSYWLITAFNSAFGATGGSYGVDALKVLGVSTGLGQVPEPGSLALAGIALLGVLASRRKAKAAV